MLGLRSKTKRFSSAIHVNYIINIQEMKPWPPSKSLKNVRSVVLHWENGSRNSGSTHPASPLDGRVEFNESFMLQVAFSKDTTGNYTGTGFERNPLEFNLYEPKKEKEKSKKHLIGSGVIDLAEHKNTSPSFTYTGNQAPLGDRQSNKNLNEDMIWQYSNKFFYFSSHMANTGIVKSTNFHFSDGCDLYWLLLWNRQGFTPACLKKKSTNNKQTKQIRN